MGGMKSVIKLDSYKYVTSNGVELKSELGWSPNIGGRNFLSGWTVTADPINNIYGASNSFLMFSNGISANLNDQYVEIYNGFGTTGGDGKSYVKFVAANKIRFNFDNTVQGFLFSEAKGSFWGFQLNGKIQYEYEVNNKDIRYLTDPNQCFPSHTLITMADGSQKAIADIVLRRSGNNMIVSLRDSKNTNVISSDKITVTDWVDQKKPH